MLTGMANGSSHFRVNFVQSFCKTSIKRMANKSVATLRIPAPSPTTACWPLPSTARPIKAAIRPIKAAAAIVSAHFGSLVETFPMLFWIFFKAKGTITSGRILPIVITQATAAKISGSVTG